MANRAHHRIIDLALYAIVVAVPLTLRAQLHQDGVLAFRTKLPLADALILVAFAVWVVRAAASGALRRAARPPLPFVALVVWALVSATVAHDRVDAAKELVQIVDAFLLGYLLLVHNIRSAAQVSRLVVVLGATTGAVILYAALQAVLLGADSPLVSSAFDDRHVLAGYLCIVLPIFFGLFLTATTARVRIWTGATVLAGVLVTSSLALFGVLFLVLVVMAAGRTRKPLAPLAVAAAFVLAVLVPVGTRVQDVASIPSRWHEPAGIDAYHEMVERSVAMTYVAPLGTIPLGRRALHLSSSLATTREVPREFMEELVAARSKDELYVGRHVAQRFLEWQAGLNAVRDRPLFGVGIGNYQNEIGAYYRSFPKLNSAEPNTQNGYLVTAATMGFVGLVLVVWILFHFFAAARRIPTHRSVAARLKPGLVGSIAAFAVANVFCPLFHQSVLMVFVVVLSLVAVLEGDALSE